MIFARYFHIRRKTQHNPFLVIQREHLRDKLGENNRRQRQRNNHKYYGKHLCEVQSRYPTPAPDNGATVPCAPTPPAAAATAANRVMPS